MPAPEHRIKQQPENSPLFNEVDPSMMSLFNVAAANNVSVQQLAMALRHQSQHRLPLFPDSIANTVTVPMTTTTTPMPMPLPTTSTASPYFLNEPPVSKKIPIKPNRSKYTAGQMVMNAPKEYYPVGYEKNFDDHFESKVDLPDTTFSCGDQKHFPGLYGDEDLGCMVSFVNFHECPLGATFFWKFYFYRLTKCIISFIHTSPKYPNGNTLKLKVSKTKHAKL